MRRNMKGKDSLIPRIEVTDMKRKSFTTLWMPVVLVSVCLILQGKVKAYASEEIAYMSGADALSEENGDRGRFSVSIH